MWCTNVFLGHWLLLPLCVVIVSLNKRSCSNKNWPTLSSTQELSSQLSAQYPTQFMTTPLWAFLQPKDTGRKRERRREKKESLECFVSRNYSPIIWSKYGITEHFVVQEAWLWSSCGRMCFALEASLWCMLSVTTRITMRSAEQGPTTSPHWEQ